MENKLEICIALEILRCLQGRRSALSFSRRLGYKSNMVHRWRSGHSVFTWQDLLDVCRKQNIPVHENLEKNTILNTKSDDLRSVLKSYLPTFKNADLAKAFEVVPSTITKWLKGESSPPADDVFKILKKSKVSWYRIVVSFLPARYESEAIAAIIKKYRVQEVLFDHPRLEALLALALTDEFAMEEKNLSKRISVATGLPEKIVAEDIKKLKSADLISWSKEKRRYVESQWNIDTSASRDHVLRCLKFWTSYHLHLASDTEYERKVLSAFATISIPYESYDKYRSLYLKFLNELMELSSPNGSSRVINTVILSGPVKLPPFGKLAAD